MGLDIYKIYKRFVFSIVALALLWGTVEFGGFLGYSCHDYCGIEWFLIGPIVLLLVLFLGIWSLVRKTPVQNELGNGDASSSQSSRFIVFIPVLIPFVYTFFSYFSENRMYQKGPFTILGLIGYYFEYLPYIFIYASPSIIAGLFLRGRSRLMSICFLVGVELAYIVFFSPSVSYVVGRGLGMFGQVLFLSGMLSIVGIPLILYFMFRERSGI